MNIENRTRLYIKNLLEYFEKEYDKFENKSDKTFNESVLRIKNQIIDAETVINNCLDEIYKNSLEILNEDKKVIVINLDNLFVNLLEINETLTKNTIDKFFNKSKSILKNKFNVKREFLEKHEVDIIRDCLNVSDFVEGTLNFRIRKFNKTNNLKYLNFSYR